MIIRTIEEERERLLDRTRRNEASALANAERRGRSNKSLEIARRMRARGDDVNSIVEMTGLTVDEVLKL